MATTAVSPLAPTIEPHKWRWVSSIEVRQGDHPAVPAPLPGMLEGRVTLIAGAGGSGKTTLCEQLVRHLSNGHRLGTFDLPDQLMVGWCLFLEDVEAMAQDRSLRAAWMGALEEDSKSERSDTPVRYLFGRDFWMSDLRRELQEARFLGVTPGVVVIDHMRLLFKSQPAGTSPNDWERQNLRLLVEMGDEFNTHFIVLTHLNKSGKISGTTELINSVDCAYVIEPSPEDPHHYASLTCHKMRMSPETDFALKKTKNGTWEFTDTVYVSENQAIGVARDIIKVLRRDGAMTLSQLITHQQIGAPRETIRKALQRSRQRGWLRLYRGHWEAVPGAGDELLATSHADIVCPLPAPSATPFGTEPAPLAPVPAPRAPEPDDEPDRWDPEPEPEDAGFKGLDVLKESIRRSNMHPLPAVPLEQRDGLPWSLITERMGGEPVSGRSRMFTRPTPMGGQLLRIDRNGSYPSACSSVRVAPNKLLHTGPLDRYDGSKAGIFQVEPVEWKNRGEWKNELVPHPLGRIVEHEAGPVWISTPHMALLVQLAQRGRIRMPAILDSWTGRGNGSLFEHFYKESRAAREVLAGDPEQQDDYTMYKKRVSTALRLLWPKQARSPFWRPDWRVSVVAEAAVRHWIRADEAVQLGREQGIELVRYSNVDEAWFWTPDGRLPAPYEAGLRFGQVKLKPITEDGDDA